MLCIEERLEQVLEILPRTKVQPLASVSFFFTSEPSSSCVQTCPGVSEKQVEGKNELLYCTGNTVFLVTLQFSLTNFLHLLSQSAVFHVCVTHILFSSFAFLPSFAALCMSHFGTETGNIIVALFGVPLLSTLLASKAKPLVLVFSLGVSTVKITRIW